MASVANSARLSARAASRYAPRRVSRRAFHASRKSTAAQNFTMPALSPTMTEGNISAWRVKEGDTFHPGDVLLEIETDKATMDVEAQDDGVLWKIMQPDGAKGVKVGQRIGVMAEESDDLSSLEVPEEDKSQVKEAKEEKQEKQDEAPKQEEAPPKQEASAPEERKEEGGTKPSPSQPAHKSSTQQTMLPSVMSLLHQNGLNPDDISPSGPNGRILKGDVLAYLGQVAKDYPAKISEQVNKFSHLDLSNIQVAEKKTSPPPAAKEEQQAEIEIPDETELALPISLTAVIATQKRVREALGIELPLSTFIARASEMANQSLPAAKRKPTSDDLFNSVLGLDTVPKSSRGHFIPQITSLAPPPLVPVRPKKVDIIDMLVPKAARAKVPEAVPVAGMSAGENVFSVSAKAGEEDRAVEYLERLKVALEREPGRLVL